MREAELLVTTISLFQKQHEINQAKQVKMKHFGAILFEYREQVIFFGIYRNLLSSSIFLASFVLLMILHFGYCRDLSHSTIRHENLQHFDNCITNKTLLAFCKSFLIESWTVSHRGIDIAEKANKSRDAHCVCSIGLAVNNEGVLFLRQIPTLMREVRSQSLHSPGPNAMQNVLSVSKCSLVACGLPPKAVSSSCQSHAQTGAKVLP